MGLLQGLAAGIAGGAAFMVDDIRAEIAQKRQAALEEARAAREDVTWGKRRERLNQDQIDQEERGYNNKLRELDEAQRRSDEQNQRAQGIYDSVKGDERGGWQSDEDKAKESRALQYKRLEALAGPGLLGTDIGKYTASQIKSGEDLDKRERELDFKEWKATQEQKIRDARNEIMRDHYTRTDAIRAAGGGSGRDDKPVKWDISIKGLDDKPNLAAEAWATEMADIAYSRNPGQNPSVIEKSVTAQAAKLARVAEEQGVDFDTVAKAYIAKLEGKTKQPNQPASQRTEKPVEQAGKGNMVKPDQSRKQILQRGTTMNDDLPAGVKRVYVNRTEKFSDSSGKVWDTLDQAILANNKKAIHGAHLFAMPGE